jgi:hypothetical protein
MSQSPEFVPAILHEMARVFADDYDRFFRVVYEDAIQMLGRLPLEPGEEIRNAFDHFAIASSCATEVDAAPVPPSADVAAIRERAWTNMEQARRHIVTGRFYCIEHQLVYQMRTIESYVTALPDNVKATISALQGGSINALEARLGGARAISLQPTIIRREVLEQITTLETKITEITDLLNEYMVLYENIRDAVESPAAPH